MNDEKKPSGMGDGGAFALGILSIVWGTTSFFVLWWLSCLGSLVGAVSIGVSACKNAKNPAGIIGLCISGTSLLVYLIGRLI